jgi:hypothetical protein
MSQDAITAAQQAAAAASAAQDAGAVETYMRYVLASNALERVRIRVEHGCEVLDRGKALLETK